MVNLKSVSYVVIMLLHEILTNIHSQKKPRLHFGESFALILGSMVERGSSDPTGPKESLHLVTHYCSSPLNCYKLC